MGRSGSFGSPQFFRVITMKFDYSKLPDGAYIARVEGNLVGKLRVIESLNCVGVLTVVRSFRRKGIAMSLIRFAVEQRGRKFNRTPDGLKNSLTLNFGKRHPELFEDP